MKRNKRIRMNEVEESTEEEKEEAGIFVKKMTEKVD